MISPPSGAKSYPVTEQEQLLAQLVQVAKNLPKTFLIELTNMANQLALRQPANPRKTPQDRNPLIAFRE